MTTAFIEGQYELQFETPEVREVACLPPDKKPKRKTKPNRHKPLSILAEGTDLPEQAVRNALPYLIDGDGDFMELHFRFHGIKYWRVIRIDNLLAYRSKLREGGMGSWGDWIVIVGRSIRSIYREDRVHVNQQIGSIEIAGSKLKRQKIVHRILIGD